MFHQVDSEIIAYMRSCAPAEGCGVIVDGRFVPLLNIASNPLENATAVITDNAQAFIHSHPGGPFYPSNVDMSAQIAAGIPWGICAFDDERSEVFYWSDEPSQAPLLGRGFRHGTADCYEAIRSAFLKLYGVNLRPYARAWRWHLSAADMYADHWYKEGFSAIPAAALLPGDAVLFMVGSRVFNHAALYLGDGLIYHHLATSRNGYDPSRLSTIDDLTMFGDIAMKVLRHEASSVNRSFGKVIRPETLA